jgi:SAM-dependent methyltransferase
MKSLPESVSRQLAWVSAADPQNSSVLRALQQRMAAFYATSASYYGDIDFTANAWQEDECYRDIVQRIEPCATIVEVGCGSANILKTHGHLTPRYWGCDFSPDLIGRNQSLYPKAHFRQITDPRRLPFESASADAVFSVFVIEHTVYPHVFLDECWRVLKPGGWLMVRCPDFLGGGKIPSQRAGFSAPNGREKFMQGKIADALVTGWDRKITIPRECAAIRKQIGGDFGFWVNVAPTCFVDPFVTDVDAIYLTYDREMISYLRNRVDFSGPWSEISARFPIYLVGRKLAETPTLASNRIINP